MPSYTQVFQDNWVRDRTGLIPDLINLCLDYLVLSKRECINELTRLGHDVQNFEQEMHRVACLDMLLRHDCPNDRRFTLAMGFVEHVIGHYPILSDLEPNWNFFEWRNFLYQAMMYPDDEMLVRLVIDCRMPFSFKNYQVNTAIGNYHRLTQETHRWFLEYGCIQPHGQDMLDGYGEYKGYREPEEDSMAQTLAWNDKYLDWAPNYIDCWIQKSHTDREYQQLLIDFVQTVQTLYSPPHERLKPLVGKAYVHLYRVLKVPRHRLIPLRRYAPGCAETNPEQWVSVRRIYSQVRNLFYLRTKPCYVPRCFYDLPFSVFYGNTDYLYLNARLRRDFRGQSRYPFQREKLQQVPVQPRLRHLRRRLRFYYQCYSQQVTDKNRCHAKKHPGFKHLVFGSVAKRMNHR